LSEAEESYGLMPRQIPADIPRGGQGRGDELAPEGDDIVGVSFTHPDSMASAPTRGRSARHTDCRPGEVAMRQVPGRGRDLVSQGGVDAAFAKLSDQVTRYLQLSRAGVLRSCITAHLRVTDAVEAASQPQHDSCFSGETEPSR
jgi:hypothetical protein